MPSENTVTIVQYGFWFASHPLRELAGVFARGFGRTDVEEIEKLIAEEVRRGHRYLIGMIGNQTVGFVSWRREFEWSHQLVELYHIARDPLAPGHGIGRKLIRAMEEDAHAQYRRLGYPGVWKFFIRTKRANRAQSLYEWAGYTKVAELPNYPRPGVTQVQYDRELPDYYVGAVPPGYQPVK